MNILHPELIALSLELHEIALNMIANNTTNPNTVTITFSEPILNVLEQGYTIQNDNYTISYTLDETTPVTANDLKTEIVLKLKNVDPLDETTYMITENNSVNDIKVTLPALTDFTGNEIVNKIHTSTEEISDIIHPELKTVLVSSSELNNIVKSSSQHVKIFLTFLENMIQNNANNPPLIDIVYDNNTIFQGLLLRESITPTALYYEWPVDQRIVGSGTIKLVNAQDYAGLNVTADSIIANVYTFNIT